MNKSSLSIILLVNCVILIECKPTQAQAPTDSKSFPKTRVQLHLHLDGAVRVSTISELAIAKNISITAHNSIAEISAAVIVDKPSNLSYFLTRLQLYAPLLIGDVVAIERIAYELVEEQARQHVIYFEARFSPHLLANTLVHRMNSKPIMANSLGAVSPSNVIEAVSRGLTRGETQFGARSRMILCTIKGHKGWASEVVSLAKQYHEQGVAAIDIAGDETTGFTKEETDAFQEAKKLGIHRTVHAGESGPPSNVAYAVEQMYAERIGHGYHVLQDPKVYQMCRDKKIHFETCPWSSILTGAVHPDSDHPHPIVTFAQDKVEFSISTDDPTVTNSTLDKEYQLLAQQWGLYELYQVRANINAARAAFLPEKEKDWLIELLYDEYWSPEEKSFKNGQYQ